jgi:transposase
MIPSSVRIFVCTRPHDMRCSYDTLALAAQKVIGQDPRSGALFVFTNKRHNRLKVLWWDRNGYCLLSKRLHQALFRLPGATWLFGQLGDHRRAGPRRAAAWRYDGSRAAGSQFRS